MGPCSVLQDFITNYLNAVAAEQRYQDLEIRAFGGVAFEVARANTRQAARVREVARENLLEHCTQHSCYPAALIDSISASCHERRAKGHRLR
jgi:hypothetical protein